MSLEATFRRVLSVVFLPAVLACLFGNCAIAAERTVAIRDDFFSPKNLLIQTGDTVGWVHQGNDAHTTTSSSNLWNSGLMHNGDTFSVTFSNLGSFPYFCQVHGQSMSGTITVTSNGVASPQDLFLVNLTGKFRTTNENGSLVVVSQKAKNFVEECAEENMRQEDDLVLVYDVQADAIVAADRNDGSTVCAVATFAGGVTLSSPDGTQRERQAFVFWEGSEEANGSLVGTERLTRGPGGELLNFSFRGSIQFGVEAYEHEPSKVFVGTFSTGHRFVPNTR